MQEQQNVSSTIGAILKLIVQALVIIAIVFWPVAFAWVFVGATFPSIRASLGGIYGLWPWYITNQDKLTNGVVVMALITFVQLIMVPAWSRSAPGRALVYGRGIGGYLRLMAYVMSRPSFWLKVAITVLVVGLADFGIVAAGAFIRDRWYDAIYPGAVEAARIVAWYGSRFVMGFVTFIIVSLVLPDSPNVMDDMKSLTAEQMQEPPLNDWLRHLLNRLYTRFPWLSWVVTSRWFFAASTFTAVGLIIVGQVLVWLGLGGRTFDFGWHGPWYLAILGIVYSAIQFLLLWIIQITLLAFSDYVVGNVGAIFSHRKISKHWPWQTYMDEFGQAKNDWESFALTAFENGVTTAGMNLIASSLASILQQALFIPVLGMSKALSELFLVMVREFITDNWANYCAWRRCRLGRSSVGTTSPDENSD